MTVPNKAEKQAKSSFTTCDVRLIILCLVEHIADKGVTWRRVALAKKTLEKRKVEEGEGKVLENYVKKEKQREGKRKKCEKSEENVQKGEREERGEKERRKGWAAGLLHDTANVVGIMPAMSRPPLHKKRPCSNRLGKTQNMR